VIIVLIHRNFKLYRRTICGD